MTSHGPASDLPRRRLLQGLGAVGLAALAGCSTALGGTSGQAVEQRSGESTHRHARLTIEILGEVREVPPGIGIGREYSESPYYDSGMQMTSIHTHDASGVIHWEMMGRPPRAGELRLGSFFDIWGRPFSETRLFDHRNDGQNEVTMLVDGSPNDQFAAYEITVRYG